VHDLSHLLKTAQRTLADSGADVIDAQDDLSKARAVRRNVSDTLETLRRVQVRVALGWVELGFAKRSRRGEERSQLSDLNVSDMSCVFVFVR
jgi:hypothetical protein